MLLASCSREASHLPSVLSLPSAIVTNTISNSIYNARRNKIKNYVVTHYEDLKTDIKKGEGDHLSELLFSADVSDVSSAQKQLQHDYTMMFKNVDLITESMMNKFSALYVGQSTAKLKTINGFSYSDASQIIRGYLEENFDRFRVSIKNKDFEGHKILADKLNIQDAGLRKLFFDDIMEQYDSYFIEPVVVGVMMATSR